MHAGRKLSFLVSLVMAGLASGLTSGWLEGREWLARSATDPGAAESRWPVRDLGVASAQDLPHGCAPGSGDDTRVIRADFTLAQASPEPQRDIYVFTKPDR